MREKIIKLYQFKELSEEQQKNILNTNREINVNDEWFSVDLDEMSDLIEEKVGIKISPKDIYFEFMSRNNSIWIDNKELIRAFCRKYQNLEDLDIPNKFGCYCNYLGGELCSSLNNSEIKDNIAVFEEIDGEELTELLKEKENQITNDKIKNDLVEIQNILSNGYKGLYDTYNYLISDDAVRDTIEINELEFEKNE